MFAYTKGMIKEIKGIITIFYLYGDDGKIMLYLSLLKSCLRQSSTGPHISLKRTTSRLADDTSCH